MALLLTAGTLAGGFVNAGSGQAAATKAIVSDIRRDVHGQATNALREDQQGAKKATANARAAAGHGTGQGMDDSGPRATTNEN